MFQTCPTKLTEWLQRFTPPQPPNPEPSGDASPSQPRAAYTGASVLVVCKHGVILGKSRHTGLWEDFGGARDESRNERPYDTAVRELKEESGLEPRDLDFGQRDPIIVSHAGHVHAVFVARMIDTATAFVVEPSGRVQSTARNRWRALGVRLLAKLRRLLRIRAERSAHSSPNQRRARHGVGGVRSSGLASKRGGSG